MAGSGKNGLVFLAVLIAFVSLAGCAQPPVNGAPPQIRDDSRGDNDHADRGMRDPHGM